ncbi:MAG: hypothetical protein LUD00_12010 [Prevotellaceae bacterium]|nr:hypothetical protein [Prevotellaceae bacterium]
MNLKKITLSISALTLALASSFAQEINAGQSSVQIKPFGSNLNRPQLISRAQKRFVTEQEISAVGNKVTATGAVSLEKAKTTLRSAKMAMTRLRKANVLSAYSRKANYTAEDTVFFENWHEWDGKTFDFIPSTWYENSNVDPSIISSATGYNPTWQIYKGDGYYTPYAVSGDYMACIPYSDDILAADNKTILTPAPQQDEWLVSPRISNAKQSNYLSFDLALTPYYMHYFIEGTDTVFDMNRLSCDLEVLVRVGGRGTSYNPDDYTSVLKVSDYVDGLIANTNMEDDNEIMKNLLDFRWHHFSISLADIDVENKSIQIAFRYTGKKGSSMLLDAIRVSDLLPVACYRIPEGCFNYGISKEFYIINGGNGTHMIAPANEELTWKNLSNDDARTFEWNYTDAAGTNISATTKDFVIPASPATDFIAYPQLKATSDTKTDIYTKAGMIKYGGNTGMSFADGSQTVYGAGNYDYSKSYWAANAGAGKYVFGTGGEAFWGSKVHGIGNLFEKPKAPYLVSEIWLSLLDFSARSTAEFSCTIYKVEDNVITDEVIATTRIKASDVVRVRDSQGITVGYSMSFPFSDIVFIDSAVFVFIEGLNQSGVNTIAPMSQVYNHDSDESYAFVALSGNNSYTLYDVAEMLQSMDGEGNMCVSMYINLNATYPYIYPTSGKNEVIIPNEGGTVSVACETYFSPENWYLYPEANWIKVDKSFNETDFTSSLNITADPLPEGVSGRHGAVRVVSMGAEMYITVLQGDAAVGIGSVESTENIKAQILGDALVLNYPNEVNAVAVYNMAGQLLKRASLPASGHYTMAADELGHGTYILHFEGNVQKTVKVIK